MIGGVPDCGVYKISLFRSGSIISANRQCSWSLNRQVNLDSNRPNKRKGNNHWKWARLYRQ